VEQLVENKLVSDYGDIYNLKFDELRSLERMAINRPQSDCGYRKEQRQYPKPFYLRVGHTPCGGAYSRCLGADVPFE